VDVLGDLDDAIDIAGELGNIRGKPSVVRKERRRVSLLDFLDEKLNLMGEAAGLRTSGPLLEYRLR
jgi:hypothetical protein